MVGVHQPEHRHVGKLERPRAQPGPVGRAGRTEFGNMAERVGAEIAIVGGIRCVAYAEGIQDEEKSPGH